MLRFFGDVLTLIGLRALASRRKDMPVASGPAPWRRRACPLRSSPSPVRRNATSCSGPHPFDNSVVCVAWSLRDERAPLGLPPQAHQSIYTLPILACRATQSCDDRSGGIAHGSDGPAEFCPGNVTRGVGRRRTCSACLHGLCAQVWAGVDPSH